MVPARHTERLSIVGEAVWRIGEQAVDRGTLCFVDAFRRRVTGDSRGFDRVLPDRARRDESSADAVEIPELGRTERMTECVRGGGSWITDQPRCADSSQPGSNCRPGVPRLTAMASKVGFGSMGFEVTGELPLADAALSGVLRVVVDQRRRLKVGDEEDAHKDQQTLGRTFFSRTEAPVGVYNGEHAIIIYDLRPLPVWPKYWIQALANHFHRQVSPAPKVDISVVDDCIRFSVFVSTEVSVEDLAKLDDVIYNAVKNAGRAIEDEQTALNQKLDRVRIRRMDTWDESYFH
jgi:hypothetical protein